MPAVKQTPSAEATVQAQCAYHIMQFFKQWLRIFDETLQLLQRVSIASYAKRCISYDRFCLTV